MRKLLDAICCRCGCGIASGKYCADCGELNRRERMGRIELSVKGGYRVVSCPGGEFVKGGIFSKSAFSETLKLGNWVAGMVVEDIENQSKYVVQESSRGQGLVWLGDGPTKLCIRCGQQRALTGFWRDSRLADGLQVYCKECKDEFRRAALAKEQE